MDLQLMARVLWRFRELVIGGLLVGALLSWLSFVSVGLSGVHYRDNEQWASYATLFVTEHGFPWGRSTLPETSDPSRFGAYATVYARLASSDPVKRRMLRSGPIDDEHESIDATPVLASDTDSNAPPLPLIRLWTVAGSAQRAVELTRRASLAFRDFLEEEQSANGIPTKKRVVVQVVKRAERAELLKGRSKTLPVVVFLTVLLAACGFAFVLENVRRPRAPAVAEPEVGTSGEIAAQAEPDRVEEAAAARAARRRERARARVVEPEVALESLPDEVGASSGTGGARRRISRVTVSEAPPARATARKRR